MEAGSLEYLRSTLWEWNSHPRIAGPSVEDVEGLIGVAEKHAREGVLEYLRGVVEASA